MEILKETWPQTMRLLERDYRPGEATWDKGIMRITLDPTRLLLIRADMAVVAKWSVHYENGKTIPETPHRKTFVRVNALADQRLSYYIRRLPCKMIDRRVRGRYAPVFMSIPNTLDT